MELKKEFNEVCKERELIKSVMVIGEIQTEKL